MSTKDTSRDDIATAQTATPAVCFDENLAEDWYDSLRDEVDYHCSFCEGLHLTIAELESKVRDAYASTARSMQGLYDSKEIANRWLGLWSFTSELLAIAKAAIEAHQICGADLTEIEKYHAAAWERFQLHCPQEVVCS